MKIKKIGLFRVDFFVFMSFFSKEFKLRGCPRRRLLLFSIENLDFAKLFISDAKNADGPFGWHHALDSLYVNFCVFDRSTVTDVDGQLKTRKPVAKQILAKLRVPHSLNLCFGR